MDLDLDSIVKSYENPYTTNISIGVNEDLQLLLERDEERVLLEEDEIPYDYSLVFWPSNVSRSPVRINFSMIRRLKEELEQKTERKVVYFDFNKKEERFGDDEELILTPNALETIRVSYHNIFGRNGFSEDSLASMVEGVKEYKIFLMDAFSLYEDMCSEAYNDSFESRRNVRMLREEFDKRMVEASTKAMGWHLTQVLSLLSSSILETLYIFGSFDNNESDERAVSLSYDYLDMLAHHSRDAKRSLINLYSELYGKSASEAYTRDMARTGILLLGLEEENEPYTTPPPGAS
ncbi:hypothetical protein GOV05_01765 [Candidatus Woesearchaeota archaeon]|nr:hypothetical protein [Candidatus Woesearchaeota archaeon]